MKRILLALATGVLLGMCVSAQIPPEFESRREDLRRKEADVQKNVNRLRGLANKIPRNTRDKAQQEVLVEYESAQGHLTAIERDLRILNLQIEEMERRQRPGAAPKTEWQEVKNVSVRMVNGARYPFNSPAWTIIEGKYERTYREGLIARQLVTTTKRKEGTRTYKEENGDVITVPLDEIETKKEWGGLVAIRGANLVEFEALGGDVYLFKGMPSGSIEIAGEKFPLYDYGDPDTANVYLSATTLVATNKMDISPITQAVVKEPEWRGFPPVNLAQKHFGTTNFTRKPFSENGFAWAEPNP
jgi:hypothetical protein